jgi:hypothetical protein
MLSPFDAVGVLRAAVGLTTPNPGDTISAPVRIVVQPISASSGQVVQVPVRIEGMPNLVSGTLEFGMRDDLFEVKAAQQRDSFGGLVAVSPGPSWPVKLVFASAGPWERTAADVAAIEVKAKTSLTGYVPAFLGGCLTDKDGRSVNTFEFRTTGVEDEGVVRTFALQSNFPNPFNPSTTISFDVARRSRVHVAVFNLLGQTVDVLVNDVRAAGTYRADWQANVGSGTYFCTLTATDDETGELLASFTQKLLLLR